MQTARTQPQTEAVMHPGVQAGGAAICEKPGVMRQRLTEHAQNALVPACNRRALHSRAA
jgi:hypothetical protein